jgi:lipopolysaccharide/colanic/teichoic acid biosynthesis glycosyltransferase
MQMMKRLMDIVLALTGLVILSPVFAATALFIKRDSEGPVFFRQERMGKGFRPFMIYKFRTMTTGAETRGARITVGGDTRITRIGHLLRKCKIDELPQLYNVLKGDMSLVGPRPEVREYVELFKREYAKLLRIRPGITDPASLRYSEEETVLSSADNWQADYTDRILPEKIRLSLGYVEKHDIFTDVGLIFRTLFKIAETR